MKKTTSKKLGTTTKTVQRAVTVRAKSKPFPTSSLFAVCFCACILMYLVFANARVNELSVSLQSMRDSLSELEQQEKELQMIVDMRASTYDIEKQAKELGMVRESDLPKVYVHAEREDKIEVNKEEEKPMDIFSIIMDALFDNIKDFAEYIDE